MIRNDATHIQLAASLADSLIPSAIVISGNPVRVTLNPPNTLTPATALENVQGLLGGSRDDTFVEEFPKQAGQPLAAFNGSVLSVDGGQGTNRLQTRVVLGANAAVQPTDQLFWGMTATNAGWQADQTGAFLVTRLVTFDQTALGADNQSLTLPANGFFERAGRRLSRA